jgi:hypothetical protein
VQPAHLPRVEQQAAAGRADKVSPDSLVAGPAVRLSGRMGLDEGNRKARIRAPDRALAASAAVHRRQPRSSVGAEP